MNTSQRQIHTCKSHKIKAMLKHENFAESYDRWTRLLPQNNLRLHIG